MKTKHILLTSLLAVAGLLTACGGTSSSAPAVSSDAAGSSSVVSSAAQSSEPAPSVISSEPSPASSEAQSSEAQVSVMTYAEFKAAEVDSEVCVTTFVQNKQSFWTDNTGTGRVSLYTQDQDGGYFIYNMACTEEQYNQLVPGTAIQVTGTKSEWSGEVEITDAEFIFLTGTDSYVAEPKDVTSIYGSETLNDYINQLVSVYGAEVVASTGANGEAKAFLYKYNDSGEAGQNCDLYFNVKIGETTYTVTVESYLMAEGSETYTAVTNLQIGDVINFEGFLYWYNGAQPHITSVELSSKSAGVMDYARYAAANVDDEVVVETYVQAKQSHWNDNGTGKASFYTEDKDGGYFLYNMPCTDEEYAKLVPGTKIKVSGTKSAWAGENEITDATFEIEEGDTYTANPIDITAVYDNCEEYQNMLISVHNAEVVASTGADGNEKAFLYKYNDSGEAGQNCDLYFNVKIGGKTYTLTVESYLMAEGSETYTAVTNLQIGDIINLEGFLYWYNGAQPHITKVTKADAKGEGVMTHAEYAAAEKDDDVVVETYVQAKQSHWNDNGTGKASIYTQDKDGGYFIYNMACTDEEYAQLVPGTKIKVTGTKSAWAGEEEITDATFEIEAGDTYIAAAEDITNIYGRSAMASYQNSLIAVNNAEVVASKGADGSDKAFLYKYNDSGEAGQNCDLYFNVKINGAVYTMTVESYLMSEGSETYTAVTSLQIGDSINLEGFLYWYNGAQPHITKVTKNLSMVA